MGIRVIALDRTSVAAGDDTDPHGCRVTVPDPTIVQDVVQAIPTAEVRFGDRTVGFLAGIAGGEATWVVATVEPRSALAVIAQQWTGPRYVVAPQTAVTADRFFVHYHAQNDPDEVYEGLLRDPAQVSRRQPR
jgi:hypothetical protein